MKSSKPKKNSSKNGPGQKIAFLDRDGVINKKAPAHQYITRPEDFHFNRGIFKLLKDLKTQGYHFIVITNQRGIARGQLSTKDLEAVHQLMRKELEKRDLQLLDIFYCPHEIDSCDCRKPKPGLLKEACHKYPIDKKGSILISDSVDDVKMGEKFGLGRCFLVSSNRPKIVL